MIPAPPGSTLKPIVLVGGMVDNQLGDDANAPAVSLLQEALEIL